MATDPTEAIVRTLRQMVHGDPAMQARLFAVSDVEEFIAAVRQLARSSGLELEERDIRQAMRIGRKEWSERKEP